MWLCYLTLEPQNPCLYPLLLNVHYQVVSSASMSWLPKWEVAVYLSQSKLTLKAISN